MTLSYADGGLSNEERARGFSAWITPEGAVHHGPGEQHDLVFRRMRYPHDWNHAIDNHHVRAYVVPERTLPPDDIDAPGEHQRREVAVEFAMHSATARRHAAAFVRAHHRHGSDIVVSEVHPDRRQARGGTFTDEKAALNFLRGRKQTDVARARQFPFGGNETVADPLIVMKLTEENWDRARRRAGLPSDFELHPLEQGIRRLITNPRFKVHTTPSRYVQGGLDLHVQPRTHEHIARVTRNNFGEEPRPRDHRWYDTRIAHLEPDEVFGPRPVLNHDSGLHDRIPEKPDDVHMWRGMSHEEWSRAQRTGYIESNRTYNMSNQQDITSFGTHPSTAESYANGFAPNGHGATFHRPAYAVKVLRSPLARPESNGSDYLEVPGRVPLSDVRAVYRGHAWMMSPGEHELSPPRETRGGYWRSGSGVGVRADVAWEKVR